MPNTAAESALDNLLEATWFDHATQPTISRTTDGEIIVWCHSEIYRIGHGGNVYRIPALHGEVVFV